MMDNDTKKKEIQVGSSDFYIRVMFRQNASWQGEIHWIKENKKKYFRSSLELTMLMQEAMDAEDIPKSELRIRSWQDRQEATLP